MWVARIARTLLLLVLTVLLAVPVLLVASPASADLPTPPSGKPTAADEATAKRHFDSGLKLYGEGAYAEALIAFEASYRLGGRPSALKNVAQCHRNLKHFVDAHEAYDQLLSAHGDKLSPPDKKAVEQALEELSVLTGTLTINVSEPGADVELDGKSIGTSPINRPKRAGVGTHRIRVSKAGFERHESDVNLGSQENKKLDVKLEVEKKAGHVIVRESSGREVHVVIDGQDMGPAPWQGDIAAGEHTIEAKGPKFAADPRKITIVAKERMDVAMEAHSLTGHLRVTTIPASAEITVGGRVVGSGVWEGDLPEGTHRIEAKIPNQPVVVREVVIARGQNMVQEIPIVGVLNIAKVVDYRGIYVAITLQPYFMAAGHVSNAAPKVAQDEERFVIGGGATIHGGYSFGWWSAEAVGSFLLQHQEERQNIPSLLAPSPPNPGGGGGNNTPPTIQDNSTTPNIFLGAGARVTSKDDIIRFTFGLSPGISIRNFSMRRQFNDHGASSQNSPGPGPNSNGEREQSFDSAGYTTFAWRADGGVLIGSTPGTKFYLGVHALLDFPPEKIVVGPERLTPLQNESFEPGRGLVVAHNPQLYVGPLLGLRFGN